MPIIAAILGAVMTGLLYWFMWGGGMAYMEGRIQSGQEKKRRLAGAQRRLESDKERAAAPVRSLDDPREAAIVLMVAAAGIRGVMTPEQESTIRGEMDRVLGLTGADADRRWSFCRFAAEQAPDRDRIPTDVAPLLKRSLEPTERGELETMLGRVVSLHGGPTDGQERFVALVRRSLASA